MKRISTSWANPAAAVRADSVSVLYRASFAARHCAALFGVCMHVLTYLFGGWSRLQRLCPDRPMEVERTYAGSSLYFGHSLFGSYRRCIDVSAGALGLRVSVRLLSSKHFLPPFVVAWSEITRCELTRMGLVGEAVKLWIGGWPHPLYLGRFLGRYGDVCKEIRDRWELARKGAAS